MHFIVLLIALSASSWQAARINKRRIRHYIEKVQSFTDEASGDDFQTVTELPPGYEQVTNGFRGHGAQGAVTEATRLSDNAHVALKQITSYGGNYSAKMEAQFYEHLRKSYLDREYLQYFVEANHVGPSWLEYSWGGEGLQGLIWTKSTSHPNMPTTCRSKLSPEQVLSISRQLLVAVYGLARAGMSHNDLKPSNILLLNGQKIVITDYGMGVTGPLKDGVGGTPYYIAPEKYFEEWSGRGRGLTEQEIARSVMDGWAAGAIIADLAFCPKTGAPGIFGLYQVIHPGIDWVEHWSQYTTVKEVLDELSKKLQAKDAGLVKTMQAGGVSDELVEVLHTLLGRRLGVHAAMNSVSPGLSLGSRWPLAFAVPWEALRSLLDRVRAGYENSLLAQPKEGRIHEAVNLLVNTLKQFDEWASSNHDLLRELAEVADHLSRAFAEICSAMQHVYDELASLSAASGTPAVDLTWELRQRHSTWKQLAKTAVDYAQATITKTETGLEKVMDAAELEVQMVDRSFSASVSLEAAKKVLESLLPQEKDLINSATSLQGVKSFFDRLDQSALDQSDFQMRFDFWKEAIPWKTSTGGVAHMSSDRIIWPDGTKAEYIGKDTTITVRDKKLSGEVIEEDESTRIKWSNGEIWTFAVSAERQNMQGAISRANKVKKSVYKLCAGVRSYIKLLVSSKFDAEILQNGFETEPPLAVEPKLRSESNIFKARE